MENMMLNIFTGNAFSTTALTGVIDKVDYKPQLLGSLNIFDPKPIRGRSLAIEKKEHGLKLVETSPLGSKPKERLVDGRNLRDFKTFRLARDFTLNFIELEGVRAFGETTILKEAQTEYASRLQELKDDMDLTREFHRLGALQGKLLDADGTSILYDYYAEFGITEPGPISFDLGNVNANLRVKCHAVTRALGRRAKGRATGAKWHALCGDDFFDTFVTHPKVERQYESQAAVRAEFASNQTWSSFEFGGITWHNYRGTDDNSTVAIPVNQAKLFPVGARGIFQEVMSPAEFDPWINTLGKRDYVLNVPDRDRGMWTKGEVYAYPLFFCAMPEALQALTI